MDLEQTAIMRLREAARMSELHYHAPLIVTTSGGKDSSVCVALAERAGIKFEVMHNHTTADAPETVRFVREEFKRLEDKGIHCILNYPTYMGGNKYVGFNPAKTYATHSHCPLLLFNSEGARWCWTIHNHWCALG